MLAISKELQMVEAALTVVVVVAAVAAFDAAAALVVDAAAAALVVDAAAAALVEESTGWAFVVVTVHKCLLTNFLLMGFEFRASGLLAVRNSLELLKIVERLGVESFVAEQMPMIGWHP
jgi:hypothetical protein